MKILIRQIVLFLLFITVAIQATPTSIQKVTFSLFLIEQIDAVLEYYRCHKDADPLCQGEQSLRRVDALIRLKNLISQIPARKTLTVGQLTSEFTSLPINPSGKIRLTRYATFTVMGRRRRNAVYNTPLLSPPGDEADLLRFRFTKQEILNGAIPESAACALVWLKRSDFEEGLMQGCIRVRLENGDQPYFNVSRNNGRPYQTGLNAKAQTRYWFFREVGQTHGYGLWSDWQLPIFPMTALAGDIIHFGLGAPILLTKGNWLHLAILADNGGAFEKNNQQLDLFLGTMKNRKEFQNLNQSLPEWVDGLILE